MIYPAGSGTMEKQSQTHVQLLPIPGVMARVDVSLERFSQHVLVNCFVI